MAAIVPKLTCDTLNVNLMGANFSGNAKAYGAIQLVTDITQDSTIRDIDPRQCSNYINKRAGSAFYGLDLTYELGDCTPLPTDCNDFHCDPITNVATPSTQTDFFEITQCMFMEINIPYKDWLDSCCGVEEYYEMVVEARRQGNLGSQIERYIYDIQGRQKDRRYEAALVAEKIQRTLNGPGGKLEQMNTYFLSKIQGAAGYNYVTDVVTGLPVGDATWELPVLYPLTAGCATSQMIINPNLLRIELDRFVRMHPECTNGFSIIGGYKFNDMFGTVDMLCCDSSGFDQSAAIRKVMGMPFNYYLDATIDTLYAPGTFFIVENATLAFFWLNLFDDPKRRLTDQDMSGIHRRSGQVSVPMSNCRTNGINLKLDAMLFSKMDCLTEPETSLQMKAQYELWVKPRKGCVGEDVPSGIYQALLTPVC